MIKALKIPSHSFEVPFNYTANALKHTEKYFLGLRNMFLNQDNFSQTKKIKLAEKFFWSFHKKCLNLRKCSQNKDNFLDIKAFSGQEEYS